MNLIQDFDHFLFQLINTKLRSPVLDNVFTYFADPIKGKNWAIFLVIAVLLIILRKNPIRRFFLLLFFALTATAADQLNHSFLKPLFSRPRPDISQLLFSINSCGLSYGGFSFPSSHAITAFCLATLISWSAPSWRWLCFLLASAVSLARVYCGNHYPSDIIAGGVLGFVVAKVAIFAVGNPIFRRSRY